MFSEMWVTSHFTVWPPIHSHRCENPTSLTFKIVAVFSSPCSTIHCRLGLQPKSFCQGRNIEKGETNEPLLLLFSHGVRLSPLGIAATVWPFVPAPDDRWWWFWSNQWNANWQGKPKYSEKTCPSTTLSTTNPTWSDPGSNPDRRGGKPETNRLSYGTA
jgi:hypothetical protein